MCATRGGQIGPQYFDDVDEITQAGLTSQAEDRTSAFAGVMEVCTPVSPEPVEG